MAANSHSERETDISDLRRLRRFLAIGYETGPYIPHTSPLRYSRDNVPTIASLISLQKSSEIISEILRFYEENLSAKPEAVIYALALCARDRDLKTKTAAYDNAFAKICKSPEELFTFVKYTQEISKTTGGSGWGIAQRKAVGSWYNSMSALDLARSVTQTIQRYGWSHRDVLKLAHVKAANEATGVVLLYIMKGYFETIRTHGGTTDDEIRKIVDFLKVVNTVKHATDDQQVARLVEENKLTLPFVPSNLQKSKEIWLSLIRTMSIKELIGCLGRLSTIGLLEGHSPAIEIIQAKITDSKVVKTERIHPLEFLIALKTYEHGKTEFPKKKPKPGEPAIKPKVKYTPNTDILNSLKKSFYASYKHLPTTNKKFLVAIDLKGPITSGRADGASHVTPLLAGAGLAMTIARTEKDHEAVVFDSGISSVQIKPDLDLESVCKIVKRNNEHITDCSLPIIWAIEKMKPVDVFLIITDKLPSSGGQACAALKQYRDILNLPNTRMATCFLMTGVTTCASLEDQLMIDLCGFDAGTPRILHNFIQTVI